MIQDSLIQQFAGQLASVGSHFALVSQPSEIRDYVAKVAQIATAKRIVVGSGISRELLQPLPTSSKFEFVSQETVSREERFSALKTAEVGLSRVDLAVAETGTLIAVTSDELERLVTALPDRHIALVPRSVLVSSLREAEGLVSRVLSQREKRLAVSLISASSRTADIGDMVILGVHGPRELHVLVVESEILGEGQSWIK